MGKIGQEFLSSSNCKMLQPKEGSMNQMKTNYDKAQILLWQETGAEARN